MHATVIRVQDVAPFKNSRSKQMFKRGNEIIVVHSTHVIKNINGLPLSEKHKEI